MTPERHQRIESLFEAALGRPTGERGAFLADACGGDPEVKGEVESLIAAHQRAGGILESNAVVHTAAVVLESVRDERVGPYRIVGEAGRGGMGVVHLAERDDGQFRRRVAIKVIRGGRDAVDLQRFEAERHILASLDHPNIARLLDGGLTDDGRPYLVMEYIEGLPINEYCREKQLGMEDRLRLFCAVARAVHHAHRNLVVHRDLKPSNIFVTEDRVVKLLDFGIAKILDPSVVGHSGPATCTGVGLMTPEYASPEQITGTPITTATDVYGLGVVLYELLAGQRPFRVEGLPLAEWARMIVREEPLAPSEAAGGVEPASPATSKGGGAERPIEGFQAPVAHNFYASTPGRVGCHARRAESHRLRRRLRGDLDRIVLMALRKEPERRYASAEQMAEDIERHLDGLPVVARSESHAYRLRKFVSRYRWRVAAAAAVFVGLVGGSILATIGMVRATRAEAVARTEAETVQRVSDFVVDLFRMSSPGEALGNSIAAREILDEGAEQIPLELADQPLVQARLLLTIGGVYTNLGLYTEAEPLLERSVELQRAESDGNRLELATSLSALAHVYGNLNRNEEAEALFEETLAIRESNYGPDHPSVATTLTDLAQIYRQEGRYYEAASLLERALASQEHSLGPDHPSLAATLFNLGDLYLSVGRYAEAESPLRRALAIQEAKLPPNHASTLSSLRDLAAAMRGLGRTADAEEFAARGAAIESSGFGS